MDGKGELSYALHSEVEIAGQRFLAVFTKTESGMLVSGIWQSGQSFSLNQLAKAVGLNALPGFLENWELALESVALTYASGESETLEFSVSLSSGTDIDFARIAGADAVSYRFMLSCENDLTFSLSDIPIVGGILPAGSAFVVNSVEVTLTPDKNTTGIRFGALMKLGGESIDLSYAPKAPENRALLAGPDTFLAVSPAQSAPPAEDQGIKWIDIQKKFLVFSLGRIGLALEGGSVAVYLDAGFSISFLSLECYALSLKIPLKGGMPEFGLRGLLVSLDKPPLKLSGGLYLDSSHGQMIYNGMLSLQISDFSFTALGSYCELDSGNGNKDASFFVFLLMEKPLGGPSCFYVTGLALGFGVNREITIPSLKNVPEFPFVKAAMGGGGLSSKDSPSQALATLSDWIKPSKGAYFAAIGVKFMSFGIATSFALLIVEFGKRTRVSLLGQSVITMPPNLKRSDNPFMYAELALRAVLDFDEGHFEVIAALTDNSYLLDPKCKLTGGFLFCAWSKGQRKGDFMISLGGCHHPLFQDKDKYPKIDKVGINWQVTRSLSIKGGGYMAVTPACVMAGCDISIDYRSGKLHAWLYASASFYMRWKPLYYDIRVGISVGVSYSTFSVELSCDLHLWGPEFSGTLKVKLWFVSFTVNFGAGSGSPSLLDWAGFSQAFLPKSGDGPTAYALSQSGTGPELNSIRVGSGVIREGISDPSGKNEKRLYVRALGLSIFTRSAMPCTGFSLNGAAVSENAMLKPSIAPMGITEYSLIQKISLLDASGKQVNQNAYSARVTLDRLSPAVWGKDPQNVNAKPIQNLGVGLEILLKEPILEDALPSSPDKWYRLSVLEDKYQKYFQWGRGEGAPVDAKQFSGFVKTDKKGRDKRLSQLSEQFGTRKDVLDGELRKNPRNYYWAQLYACKTGSRVKEGLV